MGATSKAMNHRAKLAIFSAIITGAIGLSVVVHRSIKPSLNSPTCGDFAARWKKKPPQLTFVGCKLEPHLQAARPIARYRMAGKDAILVEQFLQQQFRMAALRFICCGWEPVVARGYDRLPQPGFYQDNRGDRYEIAMYSGETLVNSRQLWSDIDTFYVTISRQVEPDAGPVETIPKPRTIRSVH